VTSAERKMMIGFQQILTTEMHEPHYTFIYNDITNTLDIITKPSCTCHTRHTKTKTELFKWYYTELKKPLSDTLYEYADRYGLDYYTYFDLIECKIKESFEKNPEYFV